MCRPMFVSVMFVSVVLTLWDDTKCLFQLGSACFSKLLTEGNRRQPESDEATYGGCEEVVHSFHVLCFRPCYADKLACMCAHMLVRHASTYTL